MNYDLINSLSSLTLVKSSILLKIADDSENCICDCILNTVEEDEDVTSINIGIGNLYVNITDDELTYKFVPSKKLEKKILKAIETGDSPLVAAVEDKLNQRILNTYKELL